MGKHASHTESEKPIPVKMGGETAGGTLVTLEEKQPLPKSKQERRGQRQPPRAAEGTQPPSKGKLRNGREGKARVPKQGPEKKVSRPSSSGKRKDGNKIKTQTNFICSLRINIVPLLALKYLLLERP